MKYDKDRECDIKLLTKKKTIISVVHGEIYETTNPLNTCDSCASQEDGKHYCLLRGEHVKNMDIMVCRDWTNKQCVCGEPTTLGVVHRTDGPCFWYVDETVKVVAETIERCACQCERRADSILQGSAVARQCAVDIRALKGEQ